MTKLSDLELTEIAAKWLGYKKGGELGFTHAEREFFYEKIGESRLGTAMEWSRVRFDPLHNWNDLMTKVVPKLAKTQAYWLVCEIYAMLIRKGNVDDLPRAILELVAELSDPDRKENDVDGK